MRRASMARASCGSCATIVLPLSVPALITVGLLTFIDKWNDFYGPLIYLQEPELQPLSLARPGLPVGPQDRLAAVDGGLGPHRRSARDPLLRRPAQVHRGNHAHRAQGLRGAQGLLAIGPIHSASQSSTRGGDHRCERSSSGWR